MQSEFGVTSNPTLPYISILMSVIFNMLMTFNEQKATVGQPGAVFLLLVFFFFLTSFV